MDRGPMQYSGEGDDLNKIDNGTVEVRQGQIIIKNPGEGGSKARITPGIGVKLYINGAEAVTGTDVSEGCSIKVDIESSEPERSIETRIEDNGMTAYAIVCYKCGEKHRLQDKPPANDMVLDTELDDKVNCQPYTLDEAVAVLKSRGIVHGIIMENLSNAINSSTGELVMVAQGDEPIDDTDDIIAARYDTNEGKKFVEINDRVDFYSIGRVVSVEAGSLVAEKIPGIDGKHGMDVYGKCVKRKSGKRIKLIPGKGVRLSGDGNMAYSQIIGRPEIRDNIASVYEVYELPKDVDISTGNIEFAGDVVVKGCVADGMKVKAGGNVTVYGGITDGEITAGGNVSIGKNTIGSSIKAGCGDIIRIKIIQYLEGFKKEIMEVYSAVEALKETGKVPKTYKDGQIIKLLMDTKFKSLSAGILEFRSLIASNRNYIDDDAIRTGAGIIRYFIGNGPLLIDSASELANLGETCGNQVLKLQVQLKQPSRIDADYIQNSNLETSGSIYIHGKGCYNSNLSCRGDVSFDRPGSVMRGGTISSAGDVKIYELGSPGGAPTIVSTDKDHAITCEIAHINSIIRVGNMSSKLDSSVKKVKAYLYKGEIMVDKSKI